MGQKQPAPVAELSSAAISRGSQPIENDKTTLLIKSAHHKPTPNSNIAAMVESSSNPSEEDTEVVLQDLYR